MPATLDHVTRTERGDFYPAPRLAFAMVHLSIVQWDRFYDSETGAWQEIPVGVEHCGPLPMRIPAGKRLNECVGYSPACGDEIVQAWACTKEEYSAFLSAERERQKALDDQEWGEF